VRLPARNLYFSLVCYLSRCISSLFVSILSVLLLQALPPDWCYPNYIWEYQLGKRIVRLIVWGNLGTCAGYVSTPLL